MLSDADIFTLRAGLIVEQIDGECLVLDMSRNVYFGLDAVALFIWTMLERGDAFGEIVAALSERYADVPREQLRQDACEFVEQLLAQELLSRK